MSIGGFGLTHRCRLPKYMRTGKKFFLGPLFNCDLIRHCSLHDFAYQPPGTFLHRFDTKLDSPNILYVNQFVRGLPATARFRFPSPRPFVGQLRNPKDLTTAFHSPRPLTARSLWQMSLFGRPQAAPPTPRSYRYPIGEWMEPKQDILQHDWRGTQCDVDALVGSDRAHNLNAYLCNITASAFLNVP